MKYAIIKDGVVTNMIVWDGVSEYDYGASDGVLALKLNDDEQVGPGYLYDGKIFTAPPPTEEEEQADEQSKLNQNKAIKASLFSEATNIISTLQDAVDLEMATDEESTQLPLWKKYRVLINRVDAETSAEITWPVRPA